MIEVGCAIIIHAGKILVSKRLEGSHLGGLWEFPGGKRQADESMPECLRREILEEIDLEIEPLYLWRLMRHDYPEKSVELHFYFCKPISLEPKVRPLEVQEIRWVLPRNLHLLDFPEADASILSELKDMNLDETLKGIY